METLRVQLDRQFHPHHSPFVWALRKGYFASENLEVDLFPPADSSASLEPLYDRQCTFGLTNPAQLCADFLRGRPVKGIARFYQSSAGIVHHRDLELEQPTDLSGTESVVLLGIDEDTGQSILRQLRSREEPDAEWSFHVPRGDPVEYLEDNPEAILLNAMLDPEGIRFNQRGVPAEFMFFSDHGIPENGSLVLVTHEEVTENQPGLVQGFIRALYRGIREVSDDPDGALQLLESHDPVPESEALCATSLPNLTRTLSQDFSCYMNWGNRLSESDSIGGFFDIDRLTDERFLPLDALDL